MNFSEKAPATPYRKALPQRLLAERLHSFLSKVLYPLYRLGARGKRVLSAFPHPHGGGTDFEFFLKDFKEGSIFLYPGTKFHYQNALWRTVHLRKQL